jgi:hypothetical protein
MHDSIVNRYFPFMRLQPGQEQTHITEAYVSIPPACTICDETGAIWTIGFRMHALGPKGEYSFNVLRNGAETGEFASRIERRNGKVRIFTVDGWKNWNGRSFF